MVDREVAPAATSAQGSVGLVVYRDHGQRNLHKSISGVILLVHIQAWSDMESCPSPSSKKASQESTQRTSTAARVSEELLSIYSLKVEIRSLKSAEPQRTVHLPHGFSRSVRVAQLSNCQKPRTNQYASTPMLFRPN